MPKPNTGTQPRPDGYFEAPLPEELADVLLLLFNTRSYVSRYRKKVDQAKTDESRRLAERNLRGYEKLKARLEAKLALGKPTSILPVAR